jgi:hypothetical protein
MILERAGLYLDVDEAKIPIQLNENLQAYIKSRHTDARIKYDLLSTGIRNFLFRLGHIYTLYFQRNIKRGFLLVDEPEASLFPDLLYDIIDRYIAVTQNTQFFTATHSPIIASQFRDTERFVLSFGDDGYVKATRGISPEGDDPNDLLLRDFGVRSLYGQKGVESWNRFLELRRLVKAEADPEKKAELLTECTDIGNKYNFAPDEIPQ